MRAYILRRLFYTVPIVFGVLLLSFVLFHLIGGDVSVAIAGEGASEETIEEVRHEYGLDKPLFFSWDSMFIDHFKGALTFNFGRARDGEKVMDKILRGVGPSLSITVPVFLGSLFVSVSLALLVGFLRGTVWDKIIVLFCVLGMSLPYLSFILFGQYFWGYKLGVFAIYYQPGLSWHEYAGLAVLIGIAAGLGGNLRFYRTVVLDEMEKDYVRAAFAKGLSSRRVLFKHVLKNAMVPIISRAAMSVPYLFLGSLLLERFFGIAGLGYLMVEAIGARDYFVINSMTYISALLFVFFNLVTDICYVLVDPRISID